MSSFNNERTEESKNYDMSCFRETDLDNCAENVSFVDKYKLQDWTAFGFSQQDLEAYNKYQNNLNSLDALQTDFGYDAIARESLSKDIAGYEDNLNMFKIARIYGLIDAEDLVEAHVEDHVLTPLSRLTEEIGAGEKERTFRENVLKYGSYDMEIDAWIAHGLSEDSFDSFSKYQQDLLTLFMFYKSPSGEDSYRNQLISGSQQYESALDAEDAVKIVAALAELMAIDEMSDCGEGPTYTYNYDYHEDVKEDDGPTLEEWAEAQRERELEWAIQNAIDDNNSV